jgi:hypothetical protein
LIEGVAAVHRRRGGWSGVRWAPELGPTLLLGRSSLRSGVGVGDGRPWTAAPGEPPLCVAVDTPAPARGSPARLPESRPRPRRCCVRERREYTGGAAAWKPKPAVGMDAPRAGGRCRKARPGPDLARLLGASAAGASPACARAHAAAGRWHCPGRRRRRIW